MGYAMLNTAKLFYIFKVLLDALGDVTCFMEYSLYS